MSIAATVSPSVPSRNFCIHQPPRSQCVLTDSSGMSLRTRFQPYLTTVEVCGAVDACNGQRLSEYVDDVAGPGRSLIVDLRGVNFLSYGGLSALVGIAVKSQRTGVRCALVTSQAVDRLLAVADGDFRLSAASSMEDALRQVGHRIVRGDYRVMSPTPETSKIAEKLEKPEPVLMHHELSDIPAKQIFRWEDEGGFAPPPSPEVRQRLTRGNRGGDNPSGAAPPLKDEATRA